MKREEFATKRKRIHELRRRGEGIQSEFERNRAKNLSIESKIDALSGQVRAFHAKNVELSQKLEEELLKRQTYHDIIESLDAQTKILETKYSAQRQRYAAVAKENEVLAQEADKLKAKKKAYNKYIQRAEGAQAAAQMRNQSLRNSLIQLDQETKTEQGFQEKARAFYKEEGLRERVERLAGGERKTGMALYTCLEAIIKSVEENEFEGVKYRTRIDKNSSKMGARLYFTNITSQYHDVLGHLGPIINEMGLRFRKYGMTIETKAKKSATGIVSALDIKVVLQTRASVEIKNEASL